MLQTHIKLRSMAETNKNHAFISYSRRDGITDVVSQNNEEEIPSPFEKDDKWGYRNKKGEIVIPLIFDYACDFSDGRARVGKDDKWGFIDMNGNTVIPFIYDLAHDFSEGLAAVLMDGKYGFIV